MARVTFAEPIGLEELTLAAAPRRIREARNITEAQFDEYVVAFTAAFSQSSRTARLALEARLLAMNRPDFFVCVNGGNPFVSFGA